MVRREPEELAEGGVCLDQLHAMHIPQLVRVQWKSQGRLCRLQRRADGRRVGSVSTSERRKTEGATRTVTHKTRCVHGGVGVDVDGNGNAKTNALASRSTEDTEA
jgi:hypothetical protein